MKAIAFTANEMKGVTMCRMNDTCVIELAPMVGLARFYQRIWDNVSMVVIGVGATDTVPWFPRDGFVIVPCGRAVSGLPPALRRIE